MGDGIAQRPYSVDAPPLKLDVLECELWVWGYGNRAKINGLSPMGQGQQCSPKPQSGGLSLRSHVCHHILQGHLAQEQAGRV
ncbi:MAG: hypothetical protein OHK0012_08230 [Synechococcales cyanobacterium]